MSNTIQIKRSSTSGSVPTAGQLAQGELAVNLADEALYTKDASNAVVKLNAPSIDDKNTGATKHVTIASGGNVGIGTSSPATRLHVAGNLFVQNDNTTNQLTIRNGSPGSNGSPQFADILFEGFTGNDKARIRGINIDSSTSSGSLSFETFNGSSLVEAMRIDSSGNLLVGTTTVTDAGKLQLTSSNLFYGFVDRAQVSGNGNPAGFFNSAGSLVGRISTNNTTTTYATSSDYRLKHDIQPMTGALAKVAQLKPVTYKWNVDDSQSQGFIAHELQEVVPECVTGEKDAVDADGNPQYQGIDTSFLVATLTAAIKEQQAIITALTARVEALEGAKA
jgi:hypothetical protein